MTIKKYLIPFLALLEPVLAVALGLSVGLLIMALVGEPNAAMYLWDGAFGNSTNFGMTIFYTVPLIFTGLSVSVGLYGGLFNIGAQGQLVAGCLAGAAVGGLFPNIPSPIAIILGCLAAFCAGGLWGGIPGYLKSKTGAHEVITTIMLNFIAIGLANWLTLYCLKNPENQNPETMPVGLGFLLSPLSWKGEPIFSSSPVTVAPFVAIFTSAIVWFLLFRTSFGFKLRAVGANETAATYGGISTAKYRIMSMFLAGGLAGLVCINEVFSSAGKFRIGISDFGFMGIAVALLGRRHPVGVIFAAFLFAALHNGSLGLEFESDKITQEVSLLLRAMVVLTVSADGLWVMFRKRIIFFSTRPTGDNLGRQAT